MPTQELDLDCTPSQWLGARRWQRPFVFDGGGRDSWGHGCAIVGHAPRATLRIDAGGVAQFQFRDGSCTRREHTDDPLIAFERFLRTHGVRKVDEVPGPFAGGVAVVLGYDLKQWIERLPDRARDDQALPVLECAWYDWALVFDYSARSWRLQSAYLTADELAAVARDLRGEHRPAAAADFRTDVTSNFTRDGYLKAVGRALAYIAAGDVYQVNLAQRFEAEQPAPAAAVFARMQRTHPMPFAGFVDCGDFAVVSNSPECFLVRQRDAIATFPIKGTRPRATDRACDRANAQALRRDPKEAAEHVMIVDLERNDLGRVCVPGTVTVGSFATVQSYPTLHHLVSHVRGQLRPGTSLAAILRATFPGGSITGAPKIRAMEIIDELEPVRRGIYTGAIGFLDGEGNGVLNIAIRTAVARGGRLTYHAGGAIVADSDPQREYDETRLKARAFFEACGAGE